VTGVDRRVALAALWSAPVLALAVSAPAAAASAVVTPAVCFDPRAGSFVVSGRVLVIKYKAAPDIYEVNAHFANGGQASFGTNYGTAPGPGATEWTVGLPAEPAWVQVHGFNTHYGEPTCPVPTLAGAAT
jgi:hypothetical protein